ncbi:MAG: DUF2723 domain-containing protein [Spirochaetia bacterium]|nr:DUF2723 domain-containing protein [Spirochaetia bacterium]
MQEKSKYIAASLLFLAVFFVYTRTMNPVFHSDDSPETIACSYTLGIQHPPGYPLPALTGKIMTMFMPGNKGFAVNLQSAVYGALAAVLIFFILFDTLSGGGIKKYCASLAGAATFAWGYTSWSQSLSAKGGIYALNVMLLLLVIYALFMWERRKEYRWFYFGVFIYGVSLANHWESMGIAFPALAAFVLLVFMNNKYYRTITPLKAATALFLGSLGLLLYAYLIIRSRGGAFLNWGDPDTFKQLLWVVAREEYTSMEKARDFGVIFRQISRAAMNISAEYTLAGLAIAVAGVWAFFTGLNKRRFALFSIMFLTVTLGLSLYFNLKTDMIWIMDVFLIPAYACLAVFIGVGVWWGLNKIGPGSRVQGPKGGSASREPGLKEQSQISSVIAKASADGNHKFQTKYAAISVVVAAVLPLLLMVSNYKKADQQRYYYGYDYGMNIVKSIDSPGAVAMLEGDYAVMPQMFFKYVEKRIDFCPVTTIFLYVPWSVKNLRNECPGLVITAPDDAKFGDKIKNIVESNYRDRAIYASVFRTTFQEFYPEGNAVLKPYGWVMKMDFDAAACLKKADAHLKTGSYRNMLHDRLYMDPSTQVGMSNYSSIYMETGNGYSAIGREDKAEEYLGRAVAISTKQTKGIALTHYGILRSKQGRFDEAAALYEKAVDENPALTEAHSNLAGIYNNLKQYDKAIASCERALKINPNFVEAYNNLAIAWYNKGDREAAIKYLEKAVSINPGNTLARQNLQALRGMK